MGHGREVERLLFYILKKSITLGLEIVLVLCFYVVGDERSGVLNIQTTIKMPGGSIREPWSIRSFWESELQCSASDDLDILWAMKDWEPILLPRVDDRNNPLFSKIVGSDVSNVHIYTRKELVERTFREADKNAKIKELQKRVSGSVRSVSGLYQAPPSATEDRENLVTYLVKELVQGSPRSLCMPISITPASEVFRSVLYPFVVNVQEARSVKAFLCTTFWWKFQQTIPLAIRDLVWLAMFYLCYGVVQQSRDAIRRSRMLLQCLMDSQWPVGVDNAKELIVLTF